MENAGEHPYHLLQCGDNRKAGCRELGNSRRKTGSLIPCTQSDPKPGQECVSMAVFKTCLLSSPTSICVISFLPISPSVWLGVEGKVILLEKLSRFTSLSLVRYEAQCKKTLRCFGRQTTRSNFPGQTEWFPSVTIRNPPDRWVLFKEKESPSKKAKHSFWYRDMWKTRLSWVVSRTEPS